MDFVDRNSRKKGMSIAPAGMSRPSERRKLSWRRPRMPCAILKVEAIGQLTGGIAHDFNNLLTGIIGSLDIVRRRIAAGRPAEISRFMDAASTSAQKAGALTHRLLAFARRQPLDIRPNNINRLVDGMEDLLRRTLGEHIELECSLAAELWTALTDANQLESAVLNLALNARDAMPDGGRLTIETTNMHLDEAYARQARRRSIPATM